MAHNPYSLCGLANNEDGSGRPQRVCGSGVRWFRDGARATGGSASGLSDAVRQAPSPDDAQRSAYRSRPTSARTAAPGTLRLNVPTSAARLVLPAIVPSFLAANPEIRLEVIADESFVDVLAAGCDAGTRYEERLEQDMIAVPIGSRVQRFAAASAPAYLDRRGRPEQPRQLLDHACLRSRFSSGTMPPWEFERDGELVRVDPAGPLLVSIPGGVDLAIEAAVAGIGIVYHFEDWLRPLLDSHRLEPLLEPWWSRFAGRFLYYAGRRLAPAPLRAFVDFTKAVGSTDRKRNTRLRGPQGLRSA